MTQGVEPVSDNNEDQVKNNQAEEMQAKGADASDGGRSTILEIQLPTHDTETI